MKIIGKWEVVPHIEFVNSFHDDTLFIDSWQEVAKKYFEQSYDQHSFQFFTASQKGRFAKQTASVNA